MQNGGSGCSRECLSKSVLSEGSAGKAFRRKANHVLAHTSNKLTRLARKAPRGLLNASSQETLAHRMVAGRGTAAKCRPAVGTYTGPQPGFTPGEPTFGNYRRGGSSLSSSSNSSKSSSSSSSKSASGCRGSPGEKKKSPSPIGTMLPPSDLF